MKDLLAQIERVLPSGGDWCSIHKAHKLAAIVAGLEPRVIVEIGVWLGGSLVPMALAQKYVGKGGIVIGIDPWSPVASVAGETVAANTQWWAEVDHDAVYERFWARVSALDLASQVKVIRAPSNEVKVPEEILRPHGEIALLHIDGNHTAQAIRDVERFCPHVELGGIAILDDVEWSGGHVAIAVERACELGFVARYPLDKGLVMQRITRP